MTAGQNTRSIVTCLCKFATKKNGPARCFFQAFNCVEQKKAMEKTEGNDALYATMSLWFMQWRAFKFTGLFFRSPFAISMEFRVENESMPFSLCAIVGHFIEMCFIYLVY